MNTTRSLGLGHSGEVDIEIAERQQVMPFYLVLDQSVSMSGDQIVNGSTLVRPARTMIRAS